MLKLLSEKGKLATLIGMLIAIPINIYFLWLFFSGGIITDDMLKDFCIFNAVAWFWFVLPSTVRITAAAFKFEIID